MKISRRAEMAPFEVMSIVGRVAELAAAGRETHALCVGQPIQGAPRPVHARAERLHRDGAALGYSAPVGTPALRAALSRHLDGWYGIDVQPNSIAITTGASGAFVAVFLTAFDPGDRVALVRPGYPAYRNLLHALGIEVAEVPVGPETGYQPTPDLLGRLHAVEPLDGLILASPANPTGSTIDPEAFADLLHWCSRRGIRVISDEIYHGIVGTGGDVDGPVPPGVCAWEIDRSSIVISSFSKYWGMTGWRLGWTLLPDELVEPVEAVAGNAALCAPVPAQEAALAAFEPEALAECERRVREILIARELLLGRLGELGWGPVAPPDGAFYLWADLGRRLGRHPDSSAWCRNLLEETGVALAPGRDFDPVDGDRFVRLSYAVGPESLDRAIDLIVDWQGRSA